MPGRKGKRMTRWQTVAQGVFGDLALVSGGTGLGSPKVAPAKQKLQERQSQLRKQPGPQGEGEGAHRAVFNVHLIGKFA